jgi:adenosylcobinamide kinase/adenosylcobinamide-phosphate guanylyltransferase
MPLQNLRVKSLLILGGARSGKSAYAQRLAEESGIEPVLIATAQAFDAEMSERIAKHKAAREKSKNKRWQLIEEPLALSEILLAKSNPACLLLVDCATLWLSNQLLQNADLTAETLRLIDCVENLSGPVIFVSNEVGQGIVPDNELARKFRDYQGSLNQSLAKACDGVVLISAGLPLELKPRAAPQIHF